MVREGGGGSWIVFLEAEREWNWALDEEVAAFCFDRFAARMLADGLVAEQMYYTTQLL